MAIIVNSILIRVQNCKIVFWTHAQKQRSLDLPLRGFDRVSSLLVAVIDSVAYTDIGLTS